MQRCGQVGDFAIDSSHRSLGPAVMLQRATFEPVQQGSLTLCYDCPPHDAGMSTFRRLGMQANCHMQRYVRPVKTDRQLAKYLGQGRLTAGVAVLGNIVLNLWTLRQHKVSGLEMAYYTERFGEEFSRLDTQVGGSNGIRGQRQATDLNWRYRDDPLHAYHVLTARRSGELVAFIIFSISDQDVQIVDLFGLVSRDIGLQLLEGVVEHVKKTSVQTLQASLSDDHSLSHVLQKAGFYYRSPGEQVVAYTPPGTAMGDVLQDKPLWSFTYADILA